MKIANEFSLGVPLDEAWPLLTDLARVTPAMPGARLDGADDGGVRATMKVKVGPITVTYRVRVALSSRDDAAHVAVLTASGREARGQGTVEAAVTARLRPDGERTAVALATDLAVTGRVAQFGGGVMKEVADRLLRQFADRLEAQLAATGAAQAAGAAPAAGPSGDPSRGADGTQQSASAAGAGASFCAPDADDIDAVDLGRAAGAALLPGGPAVGAFAGAFLGTVLGALAAALLLRRR